MSNFDEMIKGLRQDTKVPDKVWEKYMDTISNLPDKSTKTAKIPAGKKHWMSFAASAAAILAIGTTVCFTNPALAAKIPFIGSIFAEVEQDVRFPGEYSGKAEVLQGESVEKPEETKISGSNGIAENTRTEEGASVFEETGRTPNVYTAENAGVTFTASEIYCDGLSVFLSAQVEAEQGDFLDIPGKILYLDGTWTLSGDEEQNRLVNDNLEGKVVDDNTFVGMVKLDLTGMERQEGVLELDISMIGYDDVDELDAEDISAFHKIYGEWKLQLPFTVDKEAVREIEINKTENGYCLKKVFVSPYQVITYTDVPYTEEEITWEEYESIMQEKTGSTDSDDFGISYEEFVERQGKTYAECSTIIFNQDGEMVRPMEEYNGKSVNSVWNMELSKLYIYVFDSFDLWYEVMKGGMDCPAIERAVVSAEVDLK